MTPPRRLSSEQRAPTREATTNGWLNGCASPFPFAQSSFASPVLINGCGLRGLKGLTRKVDSEMLVTAGVTAHPLETLVSRSEGCRAIDIQGKGLTGHGR